MAPTHRNQELCRLPRRWHTSATGAGISACGTDTKGECLPGARPAHARRCTFVLSISSLAPSLSSPRIGKTPRWRQVTPPGTSGNPVLKKKFFVIFLTNLRPITVRPLQAGVRRPSRAMHIQKVDTLGFPTVQTDWKNSTVAPSYPPPVLLATRF